MIKKLRESFGTVILYEDFAIVEINEGIIYNTEHNEILINIGKSHFGNRPFGYISNRVHSYSLDPTVYLKSGKVDNLKAIAIVSENPRNRTTAELEKTFYCKHFEVFDNLEEAKSWMSLIVNSHQISA